MAAFIEIKEPGKEKFEITWYIGQPFKFNPFHITSIQIDGDEQFLIPYPNRVHVISGTEAIMYGIYIKDVYSDYNEPFITEEGINTLLKGNNNPQAN